MTGPLDDLAAITGAAYQADLARLQAITSEENHLRQELETLGQQERNNASANPCNLIALRQIGGDILWTAWIARKRETLNLQLATVMARKLSAAQKLRRSFGKSSVSEELCEKARNDRKSELALRVLTEEQARMVLRHRRKSRKI